MSKIFLYSALSDDGYPFDGLVIGGTVAVDNPEQLTELDSYLVIWGGNDISPFYYGEILIKMRITLVSHLFFRHS